VLKHVGSKYRPRAGDVIINWGSGNFANFAPATTLNPKVGVAANKLETFRALTKAQVRVPNWWTGKDEIALGDFPIVCRQKLTGHSGEGIVIATKPDELVAAPLYTKYVKKKDEYRVHVLRDNAFFIQRKARKLDVENPNWQVRNLAGGFAFVEVAAREVPADVLNQARAALVAVGLDFGGVDVMWNEGEAKAYVLEVNTACGLEERTANHYRNAIVAAFAD
jgi:glutathione synthase/RimK-type ligase-like ATP-grasp enzyme